MSAEEKKGTLREHRHPQPDFFIAEIMDALLAPTEN